MSIPPKEQVLDQCAQALLGDRPLAEQPDHVVALLKRLHYDEPQPPATRTHRANMLRAAAGFARLFQLRAPDAPGLIFFGAEADPGAIAPGGIGHRRFPSSGVGTSFRAAFEGCVGEAVELLSQFETAGDDARINAHLDTVTTNRFPDGAETAFPADLCLRRGPNQRLTPAWPLSIGCAAGPTYQSAVLHGLLELIERDAVALWWRGGVAGHAIPLDHQATRAVVALLAQIRQTTTRRQTWLLDITTDLAIPAVAAISVNQDGSGFACGLSANLTLAQAAESATLEMCQMELAHAVVAAKRLESGDQALNPLDRAHLRRATELKVQDCALLHPLPPRAAPPAQIASLPDLIAHLAARGIETFTIDLTRPQFAIPVARVLCPALEKEPSEATGERLRAAIQRTGGGLRHTRGIPLM
jgi:ribosomal protein S12 methylthiotransferase accessory factor